MRTLEQKPGFICAGVHVCYLNKVALLSPAFCYLNLVVWLCQHSEGG